MDIKTLNDQFISYLKKEERTLNDRVVMDLRLAIKCSEAIWGAKSVSKTDPIDLHINDKDMSKTEAERRYEEAFKKACQQYGIK